MPKTHSLFLGPVAPSEVLNCILLQKEITIDILEPITHIINQPLAT